MNISISPTTQHDAAPTPEALDKLTHALDAAILDFCEVAFAPYGSADLYGILIDEGYEEPDLISVHAMSMHLFIHREYVVSVFREALQTGRPQGHVLAACAENTKCSSASTLRRAVCRLEGRHRTTVPPNTDHDEQPPSTATRPANDEGDLLLLSAVVLDGLKAFFPVQAGIDAPTLALFLMCLQKALAAELSAPSELPGLSSSSA